MADKLIELRAFVCAAETLSFVAAGRSLGMSASAIGKNIAKLEEQLGTRLLNRSTRRISLTAEGALFYDRCRRVLEDLEDAEAMVLRSRDKPRGRLRVSLPTVGYRLLFPFVSDFLKLYPEIELDFAFTDLLTDVIEEGFDVVIRSGDLDDSRLMSRRLGSFRFVICASPDYLRERGSPKKPRDLSAHSCLRFRHEGSGKLQDWSASADGDWSDVRFPAPIVCNNMEALLMAAIAGLGIVYAPEFLVREALVAGKLRTILDDDCNDYGQFWALWPSNRHLSPKIRVFIDFIAGRLFDSQR